MENAVILAKILGPLFLIIGVGLVANRRAYQELAAEFAASPSFLYLGGFIALAGGLIILQFYSAWPAAWPVVITILAWLMLIKGAVLLIAPAAMVRLGQAWTNSGAAITVQAILVLLVGAWLSWRGYWG